MIIQLLVDNPKSWFNKYTKELIKTLKELKYEVIFLRDYNKVVKGDLLFILSCDKIIPDNILKQNKHNFVVHAAPVPKGRGWSPLTWQVLEGKNKIPVSMFEAVSKVDSGDVYIRDHIDLDGTELIDELREKLGKKVNSMVLGFVKSYPNMKGQKQEGEPMYYKKRTPNNSELDINKTIAEQFNLLRVVDNEHYPAFFMYKGQKYVLLIKKANEKSKEH